MPPLIVDADGWFTVATDAQSCQASPPSPVEKPQEDHTSAPSSRSYGQLRSRPSTGPARRKDGATARSPSGWIIAVSDIQRDSCAPSPVEKRVDDASTKSSASSSSCQDLDSEENATSSKLGDLSIRAESGEKNEDSESSVMERPIDDDSNVVPVPSKPEPTPDSAIATTIAIPEINDFSVPADKAEDKSSILSPVEAEKPADDASTASSSSPALSNASTKESITSSETSNGWTTNSNHSEKSADTTPASTESTDTASTTSTTSTSANSSVVASTNSSTSGPPKKLRPRARSSPQPIPTIGIDPKLLVGKVLTHIRRSPDHPTVTLSFADGTTYQILVDGYDPRNTPASKSDSGSSRTCVLEMDEVLLRMLEVPGRHVVDRAITDCAHIRLADKAYERREWEHSWQQTHVAVAFKFAEENRWHCVWAMRAEYDERGCIFRTFDDVYLQVLERQMPRSPQRMRVPPSPLRTPGRSPGKIDTSAYKALPKPPPSPTATRSTKSSPLKLQKKNGLKRNESWKQET